MPEVREDGKDAPRGVPVRGSVVDGQGREDVGHGERQEVDAGARGVSSGDGEKGMTGPGRERRPCLGCDGEAHRNIYGWGWTCAECGAEWGVNEDGTAWSDSGGAWSDVPEGRLLVMRSRDGAPGRTLLEVFGAEPAGG